MSIDTANKPTAIVLGGTVPHCELIEQLRQRGYYTILVDYLPDPPAKAVADLHIQESTLDKEKVLEIAREHQAKLVICGCVDQANITACYVMEQLGMKPPYSYQTAVDITNKGVMKRVMMENGINTSKYLYVESNDEITDVDLRYPVMVKPADSNSANGVRKAENISELKEYLGDALEISRNGRAIVEEYVSGQEISAYCIIKDSKAKVLLTAERISTFDGEDKVIKCYASIAPARISAKAVQEAEKTATKIAEAFGLDNTALFFQGMVNGDRIDVIEFAPRIGGGACFRTIKEKTGFDVISSIIDSWEGKAVDLSSYNDTDRLLVVNTVYGYDGTLDHFEGTEEVLSKGYAIDLYKIKSAGAVFDNSRASSSRAAFCIINAENDTDLLEKVHGIYETLKVVDVNGKNIIRKDLNLEYLWNEVKGE